MRLDNEANPSPIARRHTKREREILKWIATGKLNSEIGEILAIKPRTVEKHCENLYKKLGVDNRYGAMALAFQEQWFGKGISE